LKYQQDKSQSRNFQGRKKKKVHRWETGPPKPTCITPYGRGYDNASNNMTKRYFWMLRGATCTAQSARASPTCLSFCFCFCLIFSQISNCSWFHMVITKKHCQKTKKSLNSNFDFFYFKSILIISLCFLIVYYFLYLVKYQITTQLTL
jgi:hypothetical protein